MTKNWLVADSNTTYSCFFMQAGHRFSHSEDFEVNLRCISISRPHKLKVLYGTAAWAAFSGSVLFIKQTE